MRTGRRCTILIQLPDGILRRQHRQRTARPGAQTQHLAVIADTRAIHVRGDIDRLADAHVTELVFLEVGIDPDRIHRHDREHLGRRSHLLAQLHRPAYHIAGNGSDDLGACRRQPRCAQVGFGLQDARMVLRTGADDLGPGARQTGLRLLQQRQRAVHAVLIVLESLGGHAVLGKDGLIPLEVLARLCRAGSAERSPPRHPGLPAQIAAQHRGPSAPGWPSPWRAPDSESRGIELHQHLAALHELRLVNVDRR